MKEVAPKLWVGSQADYERAPFDPGVLDWHFVLAAKHPWHAKVVGAKPGKDHPEYLVARRRQSLILNIVDVDNPAFFAKSMMDEAVTFARTHLRLGNPVAIFCNQGRSRSATIALLVVAPEMGTDFDGAEDQFRVRYPDYNPANGVRGFARTHWAEYSTSLCNGASVAA